MPEKAKALDLGCAVGRSSFELARHCQQVVGVDNSQNFIRAAKLLQKEGQIQYSLYEEGSKLNQRTAYLPKNVEPQRVKFLCRDVMGFLEENLTYDVVLAANLICRLPKPAEFLSGAHRLVASSGQLILTTPYSWLEEFTPPSEWLQGCLDDLKHILEKHFSLKKVFDMPFLIRQHLRKYEWGVAQASIWIRNDH